MYSSIAVVYYCCCSLFVCISFLFFYDYHLSILAMAFAYFIQQSVQWMVTFIASVFWVVHYPFNYQRFKDAGRLKYVHAASVVLGFLIPSIHIWTSAIVFSEKIRTNPAYENVSVISGGFGYSNYLYTTLGCQFDSPNTLIYCANLIGAIYTAIGIPLALLTIRQLIKVSSK